MTARCYENGTHEKEEPRSEKHKREDQPCLEHEEHHIRARRENFSTRGLRWIATGGEDVTLKGRTIAVSVTCKSQAPSFCWRICFMFPTPLATKDVSGL